MDEGGDVGGADGILGMDDEVWDLEVIVDAVVEEGVKEFDYGCCFAVGVGTEVVVEGDECWVVVVSDVNALLDGTSDDGLSVFGDDGLEDVLWDEGGISLIVDEEEHGIVFLFVVLCVSLRLPDPAFGFGECSDEFIVAGPFD